MASFFPLLNTTNDSMNTSNSTRSFLDWENNEMLRITDIIWYAIVGVSSLVGNTTLAIIVLKNRHMRSATNKLILNMAFSDLAIVLVVIFPHLRIYISKSQFHLEGHIGNMYCKFIPFVRDCSMTVSILSIIAVALERFFAVVYPLRVKPRLLETKFVIPLTWLISTASFGMYFYIHKLEGTRCHQNNQFNQSSMSLFVAVSFFIVPLVFLTIIYSIIVWKLKHCNRPGHPTTQSEISRRKRNKNVAKLGIFIVASFFIFWCPYHTLLLIRFFYWKRQPPENVLRQLYVAYWVTSLLSYTSVASNPFVCMVCSSNFRQCFVKMFKSSNSVSTTNRDMLELRCQRQNGPNTSRI